MPAVKIKTLLFPILYSGGAIMANISGDIIISRENIKAIIFIYFMAISLILSIFPHFVFSRYHGDHTLLHTSATIIVIEATVAATV
jgi:hypothetical protein